MKNALASILIVASLAIGLVAGYYGGVYTTPPAQTNTVTPGNPAKFANVALVIKDGIMNGTDKQLHDVFAPSNVTVYLGQTVSLTFINFDTGNHSFTSTSLGINKVIYGASVNSNGSPNGYSTTTTLQFTPTKTGLYRWWCAIPCDSWAMAIDSKDGNPGMIGYMGGFVIVLAPTA